MTDDDEKARAKDDCAPSQPPEPPPPSEPRPKELLCTICGLKSCWR